MTVRKLKAKNTFYVTTAIDYVNANPHIGHSLEKVQADVLARWYALDGRKVFFLTGTDEHGSKTEKAAAEAGVSPKEWADKISAEFKDAWAKMEISPSKFIRTTDKDHEARVKKFILLLFKRKYIYKGIYEGLYCVGCEAFYTERDLENGLCKIHKKRCEPLKEESYFFKLSAFQKNLLEYYTNNLDFVTQRERGHEILNRLKEGLKDISITRTGIRWGVQFPLDKRHVIYVWVDALLNYITALGWPTRRFKQFWPADVHIIGKDILWFHTVIWDSMLLAAGLELPKTVFVHGYITADGQKISKSLGNVIDPRDLVKQYGADSVRYFLLRGVPSTEDGDFSERALVVRHNTELADQLGNLLNRILVLAEKYNKGKVPRGKVDVAIAKHAAESATAAGIDIERFQFHHALDHIWKFVAQLNAYINEKKPWEIKNAKERDGVLYNLLEGLRFVGVLCQPFIPNAADKILNQIGYDKKRDLKSLHKFGTLKPGAKTKRREILFKKIEIEVDSRQHSFSKAKTGGEVMEKKFNVNEMIKKIKSKSNEISYNDFSRLDLRIADVKRAEDVKGSDKLLKLQIDIGGQTKEIVAGIKQAYFPQELVGRQIVVVNNLEPREYKQFGLTSSAMLLAADEGGAPILLQPDKRVKVGSRVR